MGKKTLVQIFLFILLILLVLFTFIFFYNSDEVKQSSDKPENTNINTASSQGDQNMIESIKYTSSNNNGDVFEIFADFGEPSLINPELMLLKSVKAQIIFTNKNNINLTSDFADFNTKTFETLFFDNVKITRLDEVMTGEKLYLVLENDDELVEKDLKKEQNILRMSNNILFEKPGYTLKADILEIDLITKNLKIYMNDKLEKVFGSSKIK
tara:strand:- start:1294 stop:1926 length:633 start_codon:yes stop_codon:yes gene_type:complete